MAAGGQVPVGDSMTTGPPAMLQLALPLLHRPGPEGQAVAGFLLCASQRRTSDPSSLILGITRSPGRSPLLGWLGCHCP
ncbi:G Patch Domain-Containing Protein 1 [Manis pentadactyla]|nr:G Patch Domain-Containing Protein 1 [Manis pentadactyla]